jgi:hypothetical protein
MSFLQSRLERARAEGDEVTLGRIEEALRPFALEREAAEVWKDL